MNSDNLTDFQRQIREGIPTQLPPPRPYNNTVNHAPFRKDILSGEEKVQALKNALRYFPEHFHPVLAREFADELNRYGRIYMYRFKPSYPMQARPMDAYPAKSRQAAAIMLMIQNNLDPEVAQHPEELITYGGNGAVFQNWAQYLLTMMYLSAMTDVQTLHIYSGHPMGLFPSSPEAPRVVVTNGMMVPNYSKPDDWERYNALGVTQYGQMTAGSYMYIGPQGIVHGTTITVTNAFRKILKPDQTPAGKLFVTSGLGGMSGAQPKAGNIAGCITVCAEINPMAAHKRFSQGWVDELYDDLEKIVLRIRQAQLKNKTVSLAYLGNVVDLWEALDDAGIFVHLGSDQTSLHNPWSGGYYPAGVSFEESNRLIREDPELFREKVKESLIRQVNAINRHAARGTYFFDYGNAFLLEASRAGADIWAPNGLDFRYPSYVQDIVGPLSFDYGFGPFRWVCASGKEEDLEITDQIAREVLSGMVAGAPPEVRLQLEDNIHWIRNAGKNRLVVGSKARILYADASGRIGIARAFNRAVAETRIGPVIIGRDHHDVSGTDSPFRETSNIRDGSKFTADMAIHNVIGDSFRGATWVSIHNGGGVGWGEAINGGFGMLLDGSAETDQRLQNMLFFDVTNGISRRSWAGNSGARAAIQSEMGKSPLLEVTMPYEADDRLIREIFI
jgi:urocanate hydratase